MILADEPTAALNKERGRAVMEMLRRVAHEQGTAVVGVTNDHRSLDVSDATHAMGDGQLSEPAERRSAQARACWAHEAQKRRRPKRKSPPRSH